MERIENALLLDEIVRTLATHSKSKSWIFEGSNSLERKPQVSDNGLGRYSYRSRLLRSMIALPGALAVGTLIAALKDIYLDHLASPPENWLMFFIFFVIATYLTAIFQKSAIELDSDSIRQISLFGEKRIFWSDIKSVTINVSNVCAIRVKSDHATVPICGMINDVSLLAVQIEQRAVNAKIERGDVEGNRL
jgi:hypothetical protein